jgi:hypothetical protein
VGSDIFHLDSAVAAVRTYLDGHHSLSVLLSFACVLCVFQGFNLIVISLDQDYLDPHSKEPEYCYSDGDDTSKIHDGQGSPNFSRK